MVSHAAMHAHTTDRAGVNPGLVILGPLEVGEVGQYVAVPLLLVASLQPEHGRDEVGETEQLGYDGVTATHELEHGLSAEVFLRQEVQSRHFHTRTLTISPSSSLSL